MNALQHLWLDAPEPPLLADGEVHVWRACLHQDAATLLELWSSLSADERERAARFRFRRDTEHFVAARGALRNILGRYMNIAPRLLRFSYDRYGKPVLNGEMYGHPLHFNVSHSNGLALYAVTRARAVGIDLEFVREDFDSLEIAERFFSPREVAALRGIPPGERAVAFFDCWTRKEAYVKARGEGLSYPLHLFSVSLTPTDPAALLHTDDAPQEAVRWSLLKLSPGEGYRAALAVKEKSPCLRYWRWP
ncbi:MAG: 4'-phosphopantetheinyl transferase superfamily protein [Pyrinomonadaceae bacterium]|nr:4'-phosphopantetheinyl transferase superfamily protein [Pyrinomonadaceae bacterium]